MNFMLQTRTVYTSVSLIKQSGQYHVAIILDGLALNKQSVKNKSVNKETVI